MQFSHNACICSLNAVHLQKLMSIGLTITMVALLLLIWNLVEKKPNMSGQFAAAAEKGCWVVPMKASRARREKSLRQSAQCLSGRTWNTVISFGSYYTKKKCMGWRESAEGPQRWPNDWKAVRKAWEDQVSQPSEKKAWKDLITMFLYLKAKITPFLQGITQKIWGVMGTSYSWEDSNWTQQFSQQEQSGLD